VSGISAHSKEEHYVYCHYGMLCGERYQHSYYPRERTPLRLFEHGHISQEEKSPVHDLFAMRYDLAL
jgi:hypothetical protein